MIKYRNSSLVKVELPKLACATASAAEGGSAANLGVKVKIGILKLAKTVTLPSPLKIAFFEGRFRRDQRLYRTEKFC